MWFIVGDRLKKMVLLITVLSLLALSLTGISAAADAKSPENQVMNSYDGNLSQKRIVSIDLLSIMGLPAYFIAEAVKFKAPKAWLEAEYRANTGVGWLQWHNGIYSKRTGNCPRSEG